MSVRFISLTEQDSVRLMSLGEQDGVRLKETSHLRYANLSEIAVLLPVSKNHRPRHVSAQNTRKTNLLLIEI